MWQTILVRSADTVYYKFCELYKTNITGGLQNYYRCCFSPLLFFYLNHLNPSIPFLRRTLAKNRATSSQRLAAQAQICCFWPRGILGVEGEKKEQTN